MRTLGRYLALTIVLTGCAPGHAETPAPAAEPHHELHLPPVGPTVHVTLDGKTSDIVLASIPRNSAASASASLLEVWKAAFPGQDPAPLNFDLVGSDGFHPSSRPKCARLLTGAEIAAARIDVASHDVSWGDALALPGCYRVKAVVSMDATR
jgi:hypothetical protein